MSDDLEDDETICPFCGAASKYECDLADETGGECPWEMMDDEQ